MAKVCVFRDNLKNKAKTVRVDLSTVYNDELRVCDKTAAETLPFSAAKASMVRARRKLYPKGVHTPEQVQNFFETNDPDDTCPASKNYVRTVVVRKDNKDERGIIFYSPELINEVDDDVTSFLFDATFKTCPGQFYQCLNVAADVVGVTTLLFSVLMTRKCYTLYLAVFRAIKEQFPFITPQDCTTDYEYALARAIHNVWPECSVNGCMLHFTKAVNKKMRSHGNVKLPLIVILYSS